jgi:hypothetical protein
MLRRNRQTPADPSRQDSGDILSASGHAGSAPSPEAAGQRFSAIDLRSSLSSAVRSLMAHAPHTEGPSDDVVKTVTAQISAASDDVVDATADLLKSGSRTTVFGILAGTMVLGWIIGRSGREKLS